MRRVLTALAVLVAGILVPATSTFAAPPQATDPKPGSIGIRLLDAPAGAEEDPRARIYIVDYLRLGAVIQRHVEVTNKTDAVAHLAIYPGAASIKNGTFNVAAGHTGNELTTWIRLDRPTLTLPPGASAPVTATITVPHDASPGERYAGIWAETTTADPTKGTNVVQVSRVGVRVYLAVGPGGPPAADFTIDTLTPTRLPDGRRAVVARVHNTGGRALDLHGELTLTAGPAGLNAGPFPAQLGTTLARGQSEPVTIPLDRQIPGGPWKALVHLKSGITDRTAHAAITLPSQPGAATPTKTTSIASRALIIGATLVALAALAWGLLRRRNRRSTAG